MSAKMRLTAWIASMTLILCLITFGLFQLFPRQITSIFGSGEPLYYEFAERYLRTYMFMVCIFSVQPMSVNYFTGTGEVKQGILLSILRQGLVLIPLLLILPRFFGVSNTYT